MKIRGFEIVADKFRNFPDKSIKLPTQGSAHSAGYDFYSNETAVIEPHSKKVFITDIKAYMLDDEVLNIYVRSSIGIKKGLILSNAVAVIDKDFYENKDNDGNIGICLYNMTDKAVLIQEGERIAQGVFSKYLRSDGGNSDKSRISGLGSTGIF